MDVRIDDFDPEALKIFWYWVNERQRIYVKRGEGKPWPWTDDKILQEYRFCNVYRMQDTESVHLHTRLRTRPLIDVLWNVILFRTFNWTPTYDALGGWQSHKEFNPKVFKSILRSRKKSGFKIVTGAYMITNGSKKGAKSDLLIDALYATLQNLPHILEELRADNTMEGAVRILQREPMVGAFVAYEFACDLRFTPILSGATDVKSWANPGPGARRGVNRLLGRPAKRPYVDPYTLQSAMRCLHRIKERKLHARLHGTGTKFEMREVEHSLCEFDKYMRVKNNEGRPRSKYHAPSV